LGISHLITDQNRFQRAAPATCGVIKFSLLPGNSLRF